MKGTRNRTTAARAPRSRQSAGLLLFRTRSGAIEVFLVHPGGPFWARKDEGVWSIPKGEFETNEDPLVAAKREFEEETGIAPPAGDFERLEPIRQAGGKMVHAWAGRADFDASKIQSNTFSIELPKGSGKFREFPEVDRAAWFPLPVARQKMLKSQAPLLDQLEIRLAHTH